MLEKYPEYYGMILRGANKVLKGPDSINIDTEFWGWANLVLSIQKIPKTNGVVESRIVYANPEDPDQMFAILRQSIWDAYQTRTDILNDLTKNKQPSTTMPIISRNFVSLEMNWLYSALNSFEDLNLPLKTPINTSSFTELLHVKIMRSDRTFAEFSWSDGMLGDFVYLSQTWRLLWDQMTKLLELNKPVTPYEIWQTVPQSMYILAPMMPS